MLLIILSVVGLFQLMKKACYTTSVYLSVHLLTLDQLDQAAHIYVKGGITTYTVYMI